MFPKSLHRSTRKHQSTKGSHLVVRIADDSYFLPNSANKPKDDEIPLVQIRNQKPSEKEVGVRNISELIESLHLPDISSYFKWQTREQVYLQGKKE